MITRRDFLSAIGLAALAPSLLKAFVAPEDTRFKVARMVMRPCMEVDENGQRIGRRIIHEVQRESYVDLSFKELGPDTKLILLTRADGTTNEFELTMEEVIKDRVSTYPMKECWRIVGGRAIEVAHLGINFNIPRDIPSATLDSFPLVQPPEVSVTWKEAHWGAENWVPPTAVGTFVTPKTGMVTQSIKLL